MAARAARTATTGTGTTRARATGAAFCFVSPVFPTGSHPGARPLGVARFARLLRGRGAIPVIALGGVDGARARALPRGVAGAGAIDAFLRAS